MMKILFAADDAKRTNRKSVLSKPRLLQCFVLNDADGLDAGAEGSELRHLAQRFHADLFNLRVTASAPLASRFAAATSSQVPTTVSSTTKLAGHRTQGP